MGFLGDKDGAEQLAREAVEESPDFYAAHTVYIGILSAAGRDQQLGDYFAAEYDSSLEKYATLLRPGVNADPPPYVELAMAMRSLGQQQEPRFLALRQANLERINEERAILGYEPLTIAFYDRFDRQTGAVE